MKVLFTHSYSMSHARMLCERGELPRQHLYGADGLERAGHEVDYGPFESPAAFRRLTTATRSKLGYIEQELAMARRLDGQTVCYSGDSDILRGLAWMRRARLFRGRLAIVVHSLPPPRWTAAWIQGIDVVICLTRHTQRQLIERSRRRPERTPALGWGPDLDFPGYEPLAAEFVVSAGKVNRDLTTLLEALRRTGQPARVYSMSPEIQSAGNAEVISPEPGQPFFDFGVVLKDLRRASIVAIPIADPERLTGLSELNDALALGKPLIVTRSPHFDVDIEAVGCGIWVEPGSTDGWTRALERLSDPAEAAEMGRRGRAFAEKAWNYQRFAGGVTAAFSDLAGRPAG